MPPPLIPEITVLAPVWNEEASLRAFVERVGDTLLSRTDYAFSVLFIDDGSSDASWSTIEEICSKDARFTGIRLSRNFGSDVAIAAGFEHATGDAVVILASDLQDPPEAVLEFLEAWRDGAQIVWGRRRTRRDSAWRRVTSSLFYRIFRRTSPETGVKFTTGGFLLADREVVACYRQFRESRRVTAALVAWTGFRQEVVEYDRQERKAGKSGWTLWDMVNNAFDAFVGFTTLPIRAMAVASLLAFLLTLGLSVYVLVDWMVEETVPGWASTLLTVSVFFAMQFPLLGIVGIYLHRIHSQVVDRPLYFVSGRTRLHQPDSSEAEDTTI